MAPDQEDRIEQSEGELLDGCGYGGYGACTKTQLVAHINNLLPTCGQTACARLNDVSSASPSSVDGVRFAGSADPPDLWPGYQRRAASQSTVTMLVLGNGGGVSGAVDVTYSATDYECVEEQAPSLHLALAGRLMTSSGSAQSIFAGTATGNWMEVGAGQSDASTGFWIAIQDKNGTRVRGWLIPPTLDVDAVEWPFAADSTADVPTVLADLKSGDEPTPLPKPAVTSTIDIPPAPVLLYATNVGVFATDGRGETSQLDIIRPGEQVSQLVVSTDGDLAAWTVEQTLAAERWHESHLVIADLRARRFDTYSWQQRPTEPSDSDIPPRIGPGPSALYAAYHHMLMRFGPAGVTESRPFTIPPSAGPDGFYNACAFQRYEAVGDVHGSVLVSAIYPTGGTQVEAAYVYALKPDGFTPAFSASRGPRDPVVDPTDGSLLYVDASHQWSSVMRVDDGHEQPSTVEIPPPGPAPLGSLGTPEQVLRLTSSQGKTFVTYSMAAGNHTERRFYVATIDASGAHNVDIDASWIEAGPNGSLAYINGSGRLILRDASGSETEIATKVGTATWAMG